MDRRSAGLAAPVSEVFAADITEFINLANAVSKLSYATAASPANVASLLADRCQGCRPEGIPDRGITHKRHAANARLNCT